MNRYDAPSSLTSDEILAISDLKAQYFQHLDAHRWDRLRELFTESASFEGFAFAGPGGREGFVTTLSEFFVGVRSQHQGFMPRFQRVDEHTIRGVWSMHDYLTWAPGSRVYKGIDVEGMHGLRGYGYYEDEYQLTKEGWRISFSRLVRTRIDALIGALPITPDYEVLGPDPGWVS